MYSILKLVLTAAILLFTSLASGNAYAQEPLKLGGTGAGLGTLKLLAEAYTRAGGAAAKITPSLGSSGSIKAVAAGALDLAITSRMPDKSDAEKGLVGYAFSTTPLVFAVSATSSLKEITLTQAAAIYAKPLAELSPGVLAVPILRPMSETDGKLVMKMSPQMEQAYRAAHERRGMRIATTDTENIEDIERIQGAIGVTTLAQIKSEGRRVRPLILDGVAPSAEALAKGQYIHNRALLLVTRKQASAATQAFLAFIQSDAGRQITGQNEQLFSTE